LQRYSALLAIAFLNHKQSPIKSNCQKALNSRNIINMKKSQISPSILAADFANLGKEVNDVLAAGAGPIHFDVMDHVFVPNLSFGAPIAQSLRKAGVTAEIDAHLMVVEPENFVDEFAKAGTNMLIFHPNATKDVDATIDKILAAGMKAGLAYNPDKPVDATPEQLKKLSLILIMSVHAGFGGQKFMPESLDKIKSTRALLDQHNPECKIGVDGGVNADTIAGVASAGADLFIVGSGLFAADDYAKRMDELTA
jgi:ribulose-phosphate 3-epimerase